MPTWGPHLELGVPEIDAQHRDVAESAADLVAALEVSQTSSVERMLDAFAHHVLVHFETEERRMRETRDPRLREHVAKHDDFIARLVGLARDASDRGASTMLALRVRAALAWLRDHTDEDDRALGARSRGGATGPGTAAGEGQGEERASRGASQRSDASYR